MTTTEMGVSKKRIQKILGYMRDNIYSDKILAVIREYNCNANDEHTKFKISTPVLTGVRKGECGHEFFVRDFAKGLSDSGIRDIYAMSGESTKDDSNDEIGGFGIGAKSGLSYGSKTFFVHSYYEGVKTTYCFTLGTNEDGQECGSVCDMGRESTKETGIEVVVPIEEKDLHTFCNKIMTFVTLSPHNIEADILGMKTCSDSTVFTKKIKEYTLRLVPTNKEGRLLLQMGGITYSDLGTFDHKGAKIRKGFSLIVDIPIGKCSIALNRESFEVSDRNEKVISEIKEILNTLSEEDLNQFKNKTVLELVDDTLSEMKLYEGEIFCSHIRDLYSEVWKFVVNIRKFDSDRPIELKDGKPICAVLPENDFRSYWNEKVKNYLRNSNRNIYYFTQRSDYGKSPESLAAIKDSFDLVCARKLPYPKLTKVNGQFTVYQRNRPIGRFTAIEFFNYISEKKKWGFEAKTEKEVIDYLAPKIDAIHSVQELESLAIKYGGSKDTYLHVIGSVVFFEKLKQLGFVVAGGAVWQKVHKESVEKEQKKQALDIILSKAKKTWVSYGPKTNEAISKVRHAEKVGKFWEKIINEGSLRAKILTKMSESGGYYSTRVQINRQELRKILTLK